MEVFYTSKMNGKSLHGPVRGLSRTLNRINIYIYLDLDLFLKKKKIARYYQKDVFYALFGLRRYQVSFVKTRVLRVLGASRVHWSQALSWLIPPSAIAYRGRVSTSLTNAHHTYLSTLIL